MNQTDNLDTISISTEQVAANLSALRSALDGVIACLPFSQQREVVRHLLREAEDWEEGWAQSSSPEIQQAARMRAKASRSLARQLESQNIRQAEAHHQEAASQESDLASNL